MKKKLLVLTSLLALMLVTFLLIKSNSEEDNIEKLREQHLSFLENSPFKETQKLSRKERKAMGLPPNAYNEQLWELTMDPSTGRPMPERLFATQQELITQREVARGVGGQTTNPWVDRGPNNQGGRTRGIMFDPNDINNANPADDYTRVFAGGVSGGLWVNDDITDANSSWNLVTGIQANISVIAIISDPNDSNTFYIASGESFTFQSVGVGRGIWKSTDGGATWSNIFGGYDSFVTLGGQGIVNGVFYVNDIVARDNGGVTEIYAGIVGKQYYEAASPVNFQGVAEQGLYKSTDGGTSWNRFDITHSDGSHKNPSDIEIDINNNIWFTTTSNAFGNAGGDIYSSSDGITFNLIRTINGASRTELEVSSTDPNRFWVAASINSQGRLFTTTDAFATAGNLTTMTIPVDEDVATIPSGDYTRGQAFYDLPIESDQNGNVYIGGINLFTSSNNGASWTQISEWYNINGFEASFVHADQHAIVFRPGSNDTQVVFGNDGGVYYSDNITNAPGNTTNIQTRNKDYNTTQFYFGTIDESTLTDNFGGGLQDNGSMFITNGVAGSNPFDEKRGGDGGFTEIDDSGYAILSNPGNNHYFYNYPALTSVGQLSSGEGGTFVNQAVLDKNLNILYSDATTGGTVRIERVKEFLPGGPPLERTFLTSGQFNATVTALKVSPYSTTSTSLYVGLASGRILVGGFADFTIPSFTNISGPGFVGSISDIEFGQNAQEIFVTMHNYGVVSVWFSGNGGNTWSNIEGNLPDIPVKCILQNPLIPEELIIGTDLGIWATPDYTVANPVWVQAYNGMSDVQVLDLDLRAADNTILAATHGRGLFTSQFTNQPLSVLEHEFNENVITLFPTISNGQITIKSERDLGNASIKVFNINAQEVYSTKSNISTSNTNVNLNLNAGMYFVNITVDNYSETKKIIIK
ncbi:T9SS type A sorting domain-containing protein [Psychroserpens sp. AS72]|uniref:T9SS type A sorting domain-containing protein n=1 Tax=Psychroserpens sp. AS72 TaxID=3135775 RepID=UPI00317BD0C0